MTVRCCHLACEWSGKFGDFIDHEASCKHRQVVCSDCGVKIAKSKLKQHTDPELGDCKKLTCPFDCGETNSAKHQKENLAKHSLLILNKIKQLNDSVRGQGRGSGQPSILDNKINDLEKKVEDLELQQGEFVKQGAIVRSTERIPHDALQSLQDKNTTVEGITAVLNREIEKLIGDMSALEHQRNLTQCTIETMQSKITSLERTIALKDVDLADKQLRLEAIESTSYDGTFVWRLTDFRRRRQDSISGRTPSLYSPPFYTSKSGYKVCARIYLNGDGSGRGTHISLFFVVMRGQYDPILTWPFPFKVMLMMLDQTGSDHIVDGFRPDPSSSSFRRPITDMNVASGMPVFCPVTQVDSFSSKYVKDDTMFIKIVILCND